MMMETILTLSGIDFPPMSARGCKQTLSLIDAGRMLRTINGDLHYIDAGPAKYRSTIECEDKTAPSLNQISRGAELDVGCVQRLCQTLPAGVSELQLTRDPVADSVVAMTKDQSVGVVAGVAGRKVRLAATEGCEVYISYRPLLRMRVLNFELRTDEWGMAVGWRLELEEV